MQAAILGTKVALIYLVSGLQKNDSLPELWGSLITKVNVGRPQQSNTTNFTECIAHLIIGWAQYDLTSVIPQELLFATEHKKTDIKEYCTLVNCGRNEYWPYGIIHSHLLEVPLLDVPHDQLPPGVIGGGVDHCLGHVPHGQVVLW